MDPNSKRSPQTRERFPAIPPRRTFLSSTENVPCERPVSGAHRHNPCAPYAESSKRQRPDSGKSFTSVVVEIKRQRPGSNTKSSNSPEPAKEFITTGRTNTVAEIDDKIAKAYSKIEALKQQAVSLEDKLKSISDQRSSNIHSPTPNLSSTSSAFAATSAATPVVVDAKAEKKRRKQEKKEREAKRMDETRKKEQERLEAEKMMAEISKHRCKFNGKKDALPAIGSKTAQMPVMKEHELTGPPMPQDTAVHVIRRHEAQVRATTFLKEISQDYINTSVELMEPCRTNEAIEIIERHEDKFGKAYTTKLLTGCYDSTSKPSTARSRCSSGVSRRGAA